MHYIVVHESTHCKEQLAVPQVALGVRFWRMPICRRERQRAVKLFCLRRPRQCRGDRKSTRLNSSHSQISYAVFCLKKKKTTKNERKSRCTDAEWKHQVKQMSGYYAARKKKCYSDTVKHGKEKTSDNNKQWRNSLNP